MPHTQHIFDLDRESFERRVLESTLPVLVDFWAPWCAPCRALAPMIEEVASELGGRVSIGKVDIDSNPQLVEQYSVESVPTLLFFSSGKLVERLVGRVSKHDLLTKLRVLAA